MLKKLAGQTAIYGIPSIVGRLINFILVFVFTDYFQPEIFAAHVSFYAYAAFFLVLLPHGMETAFFNFIRRGEKLENTFATSWLSVSFLSVAFLVLGIFLQQDIADAMGYSKHPEYVVYFAFILCFDVMAMIPFALLRHKNKAKYFALVRSIGIIVNVALTIIFIVLMPEWTDKQQTWYYNPQIGIGYVFIANLVSSGLMLLLLLPEGVRSWGKFDSALWKSMLKYAWPLIFVGLAGIVNETFDRVALEKLLTTPNPKYDLGVYGAFYKLSIIITIFIQAFRYAAEPFFFERAKHTDAKLVYAQVMNYFVAVCLFIALGTLFYIEFIAHFAIRKASYFEHADGLRIVAPLLLANIFLGINYNLSIWYKVKEKNTTGAIISAVGAICTIVLLFLLIPTYGFIAAAYITLFVYVLMAILSYIYGQRHYPVPYNIVKIGVLFLIAFSLYILDRYTMPELNLQTCIVKGAMLLSFVFVAIVMLKSPKKM